MQSVDSEMPDVSVDSEMPDVSVDSKMLDVSVDSEMPDVSVDRNSVSSEDGIKRFSHGRPSTSPAGQGNLFNNRDDVSRGGESIPQGQDGRPAAVSNIAGYAVLSDGDRPISVFILGPQELLAFDAIRDALYHECSPIPDGEDIIQVGYDRYAFEFSRACEEYLRTAGQNNMHWSTVLS
jgi:hypothetical protein